MLSIFLLIIQLLCTGLGIYLFDYQLDFAINDPLVIVLSVVIGFLIMLTVLLLYIQILYYLVAVKKPKSSMLKHKIAKQMISIPMHLINMRAKVIGMENLPQDKGFTIYSNHTSLMDIPLLMYKLYEYPVGFLAKESVAKIPFIGKWTHELGCVMLDRSNARKGAEAIINVIKNTKSGSTMVVFPEGTRNTEIGKLLPFKDGAFKAAIKSKKPLVPLSIVKEKNYNKTIWPLPRKVTIVIHEPIPFEELKKLKTNELSDKVENIIKSSLM